MPARGPKLYIHHCSCSCLNHYWGYATSSYCVKYRDILVFCEGCYELFRISFYLCYDIIQSGSRNLEKCLGTSRVKGDRHHTIQERGVNRPISQIPQSIIIISHNAPVCNRNVHTCAHFCYKMIHCGNLWDTGPANYGVYWSYNRAECL